MNPNDMHKAFQTNSQSRFEAFSIILENGATLTGIAHIPRAKTDTKHGAPLLVGIHGASCSAYHFDFSPEYTASLYSDMCGVPFVAFNRPNFLDSSGWQIDRSSAVSDKPGFDKEDGLSHFQEEAKWLQSYILPALWTNFGVPNGCTSIVTLSHSMSVPMTIMAAARYSDQPETERRYLWAGIIMYGYSEVHTQHCNDRSASAMSNPHREPDEIPLGQDERFHIPPFPTDDRVDLMCGPRGCEPDPTMRNKIARNATPFLISEIVEMDSWGVPDKSQYKSSVRIPVMYGHPEYDWVWQGSKRNVDAFLKDFTNAPRVEGAVIQGAPHSIDLGRTSRGWWIRCFGFAIEVAEGLVVAEWKDKPYQNFEQGTWPDDH